MTHYHTTTIEQAAQRAAATPGCVGLLIDYRDGPACGWRGAVTVEHPYIDDLVDVAVGYHVGPKGSGWIELNMGVAR